jgi:uridine phosphorylase
MNQTEVPLLTNKHYASPSVFLPANLLREARRQKSSPEGIVPSICILDPDGDLVTYLRTLERGSPCRSWACYHTDLDEFEHEGDHYGIIGCAVGGSFAVLLAEQLFASGCELLISITSAGQITTRWDPPYFVLIESALRDEGTSYHYLPPSQYAHLSQSLQEMFARAFDQFIPRVETGRVWTTDAPYRETDHAIGEARAEGILAVEMEAASLYAFAEARKRPVVCFAHVTNQMGLIQGDFEKGEESGCKDCLRLIHRVTQCWKKSMCKDRGYHFPEITTEEGEGRIR